MPSDTPSIIIGTKYQHIYVERAAVRLILRDRTDRVAMLWVEKRQYFKLLGGGIEGDENHIVAAEREAMEETGCKVCFDATCIATSEEWRNDLHQVSWCYQARVVEDTGVLELTEEEKNEGLVHQWCSPEEAELKLKEDARRRRLVATFSSAMPSS